MEIDKIYVSLERYGSMKLRIYEIDKTGHVFWKRDKTLHVGISYLPEWRQYVQDVSLQIYPKVGNILEIPKKLKNLKYLEQPKQ
ncbi:MAG: hypothetical protein HFG32_00365 [Eubacterium sp.]|nr:hypothetical protein [Eubacterium sp.]